MSKDSNPLDKLGQANLEAYHKKQDQLLIEALRKKQAISDAIESIKSATGVEDDALLTRLAELGITAEKVPTLHLIPLLDVAWADGEIQDAERALLVEAARIHGVEEGPALSFFEDLLATPPSRELVSAASSFIASLLSILPNDEADAMKTNLVNLSVGIADACGGFLGLWGRIDDDERKALNRIAAAIASEHPDAAKELLARI